MLLEKKINMNKLWRENADEMQTSSNILSRDLKCDQETLQVIIEVVVSLQKQQNMQNQT